MFWLNLKNNDIRSFDSLYNYVSEKTSHFVITSSKGTEWFPRKDSSLRLASINSVKRCGIDCFLVEWAGIVPENCRNTTLFIPLSMTRYFGGDPERLASRFQSYSSGDYLWSKHELIVQPYSEVVVSGVGVITSDFDFGKSLLLAIILKETDELIGSLSLFNIHAESKRAEIGYILLQLFWRKGLMSESFETLIHFCFEHLKLNRLKAEIDPNNKASSALLGKAGCKAEGLLKERWSINGDVTDSEIYGLVKTNYDKQLT